DQDICYATQNRQDAVKVIAARAEVILVVGAKNSSNSNRLVEVAARAGARAYLIESVDEVRPGWIAGCTRVGVTAGASTPDRVVGEVMRELRGRGYLGVEGVKRIDDGDRFSV